MVFYLCFDIVRSYEEVGELDGEAIVEEEEEEDIVGEVEFASLSLEGIVEVRRKQNCKDVRKTKKCKI